MANKECEFCGEDVKASAIKCKHCGEFLDGRPAAGEQGNDAVQSLIPTKNPQALMAYYCGIFSLIPCLAILLGPAAMILGLLGLKKLKTKPNMPGKGHAYAGIILGGLTFVANLGVIVYPFLVR